MTLPAALIADLLIPNKCNLFLKQGRSILVDKAYDQEHSAYECNLATRLKLMMVKVYLLGRTMGEV